MKIKLFIHKTLIFFIFFSALPSLGLAYKKTIALTIDDLPFVGEYRNFHLNMIMKTLMRHQIPATGFIIASEVRHNNWDMLNKWRDAGFDLGNHTFSHANLNKSTVARYIQEIKKADLLLTSVLTRPKYFRYPYLAMSDGDKKNKIVCYLEKKNYHIAPITIDTKDFSFNQRVFSLPEPKRREFLNDLTPFYLEFIWLQTLKAIDFNRYHHHPDQAQILLIHANLLNAYVLTDIIQLYQERGYQFVSLEEALNTFTDSVICKKNKTQPPAILPHSIESFVKWE